MKNPFVSKTIWFNAAALLLSVANNYGQVLPAVDPGIQVGVMAGANLLLRLITHQPIDLPTVLASLLRRR